MEVKINVRGSLVIFGYFFSGLILLSFLTSCGDVKSKASTPVSEQPSGNELPEQSTVSEVLISAADLNFSEAVFTEEKWYSYNFFGHRIYPFFNVYGIQSKGKYYKFQIIDYYNDKNEGGFYTLRLQSEDGLTQMVQVDAFSCGTPTGGVTVQCNEIDTYTLLNLETLTISKMTIDEAQKLNDWDIGFKRTDVIINGRSFGRGNVDGALIFKNKDFFDGRGNPNYQKLMDAYTQGGELEAFERVGRLVGP